jgi:tellurite resistance protein TerC
MLRHLKRTAILIIGAAVLLVGVALIALPGPAVLVIPAGLAILATEFAWARSWQRAIRESVEKGAAKLNLGSLVRRRP